MAGHVVNSRRANLKHTSVNHILFSHTALTTYKEGLQVDEKVSHFYIRSAVLIKSFCLALK